MSTDEGSDVSRRGFLRAATVTAGTAGVAGQAAAQESTSTGEGTTKPDYGGWLDGVDGGYEDLRGESEVTVTVGAEGNGGTYAFSPAGIWVDPGTTITWEWASDTHNVAPQETPGGASWSGEPDISNEGHTYSASLDTGGIYTYLCEPHKNNGMNGAIAVGDDVSTITITPEPEGPLGDSAKALGVAGAGTMAGVLGLAYFFIKYGGAGGAD